MMYLRSKNILFYGSSVLARARTVYSYVRASSAIGGRHGAVAATATMDPLSPGSKNMSIFSGLQDSQFAHFPGA